MSTLKTNNIHYSCNKTIPLKYKAILKRQIMKITAKKYNMAHLNNLVDKLCLIVYPVYVFVSCTSWKDRRTTAQQNRVNGLSQL